MMMKPLCNMMINTRIWLLMSQGNGKTETTVEMQFSQCCRRRGARSTSRQNSTMDAWADNIEFIDRPTRGSIPCLGPRPTRGSSLLGMRFWDETLRWCKSQQEAQFLVQHIFWWFWWKPTRGFFLVRHIHTEMRFTTTNKRFLPCWVRILMIYLWYK